MLKYSSTSAVSQIFGQGVNGAALTLILRNLQNGEVVSVGLRKRTYFPELLEHLSQKRVEYQTRLDGLPSPKQMAPDYARDYIDKVEAYADELDDVRKELKRLNERIDLDDSQKRQRRPAIIQRYISLRRDFRLWLDDWEEMKSGYGANAELYFCKPDPSEVDYERGRRYRWYFRFQSVASYNGVKDIEAHMVAYEILTLRKLLSR